MLRGKITKSELARRLEMHLPHRLLDVHHASRIDQLERALLALGTRLVLVFRPVGAPRPAVRAARRRRRRIRADSGDVRRARTTRR
jgi:hypothetical protein